MPTLLAPVRLAHLSSPLSASAVGRLAEHANDACYDLAYLVERCNRVTATARQLAWFEDMLNAGLNGSVLTFTGSGTGNNITASSSTSGHPGINNLTTGTTSTGSAAMLTSPAAILLGGGLLSVEWCVRPVAATYNASNTATIRVGLLDATSGAGVDGLWFEWDPNAASSWSAVSSSNSSRTTNAAVSSAATGTWYRLRIDVNAAASSAGYYVNGSSVSTITTNIPTGAGRETGVGCSITNTAGTTAHTIDVDYLAFVQQFTTAR